MRLRIFLLAAASVLAWSCQTMSQPLPDRSVGRVAGTPAIPQRGNQAFDSVLFSLKQAPKIIGGPPAPDGSYPWLASLQRADHMPGYGHYCAASIYNERWLVTAAHCLVNLRETDVLVTAGTHRIADTSPRAKSALFLIHKLYGKQTDHDYDIALVQLEQPLAFGPNARPIDLIGEPGEDPWVGKKLMAAGWGATQEGGNAEKILREVALPLLTRAQCADPMRYGGKFTNQMICAGYLGVDDPPDTCNGDSGGSLSTARAGNAQLAGIVSWGVRCGQRDFPTLYSRVSVLADWVRQCVGNPSSCK